MAAKHDADQRKLKSCAERDSQQPSSVLSVMQ